MTTTQDLIAQPPAPSDTAITYMTGYSDGREWAGATSQAQPEPVNAGLVELLEPAFTEIQHALGSTLEFPYQRKSLETALELVRAAITAIKQAQPSQEQAPDEAAREYMTGYSDCKEWAQPSQAVELSDEEQVALLRFNETCEDGQGYDVKPSMMSRLAEIGVVSRKFGSVYFVTEYGQRVIAAINAKERAAHGIKQGGQQ